MSSERNTIQIQDEYIAAMKAISPSNRNYCVLVAKASRKLIDELKTAGLSGSQAERALYDAHEVMQNERVAA